MKRRQILSAGLAVLLIAVGAGASRIKIAERWSDPNFDKKPFRNLLIIGIGEDTEARKQFEFKFISHLRGRGIHGIPSRSIVPDLGGEIDREKVIEELDRRAVDGAITVRVVPLKQHGGAEEWATSWRNWLDRRETIRDLVRRTLAESTDKSSKYGVEVALWKSGRWNCVWAGRTDGYSRKQVRKGASDFVQAVMDALKNERLM